ncbi:MAG: O-antigen ligase family protein [Nitrososphaeraceae archaeon]
MFSVFIITAFKPKVGLYLFIFFIPLLNSLTTILEIRPVPTLLFLFFGFFLGFLLSFFGKDFNNRLSLVHGYDYYEREIGITSVTFLLILIISLGITVFRYANFYPFITNNYYNLKVNVAGSESSSTIQWVISYFFNYAIGFAFLFSVFNIFDKKKDIIIAVLTLIFSTTLVSIFSIYQYFVNPYIGSFDYWVESGRLNSTFTDPNALGAYCVLIFPIFLSLIIFTKRWYLKLLFSILFIPFILMIFFSGSRSALLGIFLSLIIFFIYGIIRYIKYLATLNKRKRLINISVILVVILLIAVSLSGIFLTENKLKNGFLEVGLVHRSIQSFNTLVSHFKKDGLIESLKSISNYRYIYWNMAINMGKEYPLNGVGIGSYIIELPDYLESFKIGFKQIDFAGNYYLQVLAELGLPGLVLILFLFFIIIKKTILYFNYKRKINEININDRLLFGFFISFITMLVVLFFGPHTNFMEIQFIFWTVISLIIVYIKINQLKSASENSSNVLENKKLFPRKPLTLSNKLNITLGQKISLSLILLIFLSSYMISSITTLSIYAKQNRNDFENQYGFSDYDKLEDKMVRWTSIDASEVITKEGSILIIPIQDGYPEEKYIKIKEPPEPLVIKIYIDNLMVERLKLKDDSWYNMRINIPDFTNNKFTLTLVMNRSWVPKVLGLNNDTRALGARVGEYKFEKD